MLGRMQPCAPARPIAIAAQFLENHGSGFRISAVRFGSIGRHRGPSPAFHPTRPLSHFRSRRRASGVGNHVLDCTHEQKLMLTTQQTHPLPTHTHTHTHSHRRLSQLVSKCRKSRFSIRALRDLGHAAFTPHKTCHPLGNRNPKS